MKISKKSVDVYRLRDLGDIGWADITIDSDENSGRITIASDWGNWQRYWGSCGMPFKDFLIGLRNNIHYMADKMNADNWFDFDATIVNYKETILRFRREEQFDAELLRKAYDELKAMKDELCTDKQHFSVLFYNSQYLNEIFEHPETIESISPQFQNFWKKAFLPFIEHLQSEIKIDTPSV